MLFSPAAWRAKGDAAVTKLMCQSSPRAFPALSRSESSYVLDIPVRMAELKFAQTQHPDAADQSPSLSDQEGDILRPLTDSKRESEGEIVEGATERSSHRESDVKQEFVVGVTAADIFLGGEMPNLTSDKSVVEKDVEALADQVIALWLAR
jgi:hypothetical protein